MSGVGSDLSNIGGIVSGVQSGKPTGYASAGINTAALASRNGAFGSNTSAVNSGVGTAAGLLQAYQGFSRGGVMGDTQGAVGLARAGTSAGYLGGASGAFGKYIPIVGDALAVYNFAQNEQSGKTGADALSGAETGAEIGSSFGPIGTVVGGIIGGVVGAAGSALGPGAMDPENVNWDSYAAAYDKNPNSVNGATPSQNFQALTGIFDSRGTAIPFYGKFGRMGENQFMNAMTQQINSAVSSGKVSKTASAQDIYSQVVQPWINSMSNNGWQQTYTAKGAAEQGAVGNVLTNLIQQWQSGALNSSTPVGVDGQTINGLSPYAGTYTGPSPVEQQLASSLAIRPRSSRFGSGASRYF